ncbi:MAG: T9SS type A sorting domain-containing protein, partial [Bacteroidia bacterium]
GDGGLTNGDKNLKARFFYPTGLFIDSKDNIYVADKSNSRIRLIEKSTGNVSAVFKDLWTPEAVIVDSTGTIITSHGCQIIGLNGNDTFRVGNYPRVMCGYKNASDTNALLDGAKGILQISANEYLFCDQNNHVIRKFETDACVNVKANITAKGKLEFCEGSSVDLEGLGSASNSWTWKNGNSSNTTITVNETGWYTLEVNKSVGTASCSDTAGVFVKVNANPAPQIVGTLSFCPGKSTELSTNKAYSNYSWSTNESTNKITVSTATTIDVKVTDAKGCQGTSASVTTSVFKTNNPQITASGNTEFCQGESVELEATGGFTSYKWSDNSSTNKITVSAAGLYSVTVVDNNGCETESSNIEVIVNPLPAKPSVQSDNDSVYTIASAESYTWYLGGSQIKTTTVPYIIVEEPGKYAVEVFDANECSNLSDEYQVIIMGTNRVNESIKLYPNPASTFLMVQGINNFNYTITDITGKQRVIGQATNKIELPALPSGTYFLKLKKLDLNYTHRIIIVQ